MCLKGWGHLNAFHLVRSRNSYLWSFVEMQHQNLIFQSNEVLYCESDTSSDYYGCRIIPCNSSLPWACNKDKVLKYTFRISGEELSYSWQSCIFSFVLFFFAHDKMFIAWWKRITGCWKWESKRHHHDGHMDVLSLYASPFSYWN